MFLLAGINVYAEEDIYYTNDNGVSLTKTEYDFFTKMYWDGYQEFVTPDGFKEYVCRRTFQLHLRMCICDSGRIDLSF